jgi:hypothetical protein
LLTICCMYDQTMASLKDHLVGYARRSESAIGSHLRKMKDNGQIPQAWNSKAQEREPIAPWGEEEDLEIMRWHVSKRNKIDAKVFIPKDRMGHSVRARGNILVQDEQLAREAEQIEKEAGAHQLHQDLQMNLDRLGDERPDEENARARLLQEIQASLARRNMQPHPQPQPPPAPQTQPPSV